ncbi:MAG: hypothetical protein GWP91_16090 [Rhodobacterales bacterium]|nr:hypothetical protein [Rhodobacterales bacterium]
MMRRVVRGGSIGLWVGTTGALVLAITRQVGLLNADLALPLSAVVVIGSVAIGGAIGGWRGALDRRETALLLDRVLHTDELLVTSEWLSKQPPETVRNAILDQLQKVDPARIRRSLPIQVPRRSPWAGGLLALALAGLIAPAWQPALALNAVKSDKLVAREGARLAERLDATLDEDNPVLPNNLVREVSELAAEMTGDELSQEEALDRLNNLQDLLSAFEDQLAKQKDVLENLEDAAKALDESTANQLADALAQNDLSAAADAARDLSDALSQASPEQRQQTAEAMQQAGEAMSNSADPQMQQAGEAMQQAAQSVQQGEQGQPGEGQEDPESEQGLSQSEANSLAQSLDQARQAGEQLQRDKEALDKSQEMNSALESSRQRMGGEPGVEQGEGEGQEGGEGQGEGDGQGEGQASQGLDQVAAVGDGAGEGHTWEDEGEFDKTTLSEGGHESTEG